MKPEKTIPPKLGKQVLLFFLRENLAEEVVGDLDEKFYVTLNTKSRLKAKLPGNQSSDDESCEEPQVRINV